MKTQSEIVQFLKEHKQELNDKFGIKEVALFGSYARDEANENSDVDLAIVSMKKKNGFTIAKARNYLIDQLKMNVDLGLLDSIRPFIKKRIEKELIFV